MTIEEEIEGNKLLHKFLTGKDHNLPFGNKYNLSWDRLMPVYQKLASIFDISSMSFKGSYSFILCSSAIYKGKSIQEVFELVINCVKELNKAQGE
jgi:hypothetical protein